MESNGTTSAAIVYRVDRLERDVGALQQNTAPNSAVAALREEMDNLRDDMKSLRNALMAFALGIPGGAIIAVAGYVFGGHH